MKEKMLIKEALKEFCDKNRTLFKDSVSEQAICASLSQCLLLSIRENYTEFNAYYVDVEYNRGYAGQRKYIMQKNGDELRLRSVVCDLVIHNRGEQTAPRENLIAIEMKKTSDCIRKVGSKTEKDYFKNRRESDIARLKALTANSSKATGDGLYPIKNEINQKTFVEGFQLGVFIELCDKEINTDYPENFWKESSIKQIKIRFFVDGEEVVNENYSIKFNNKSFEIH